MQPVYEPNGRVVFHTWTSYEDARREALKTGLDLVVLVDVDDATRWRVAHEVGAAAIVCTATPSEVYKFGGAGVYRYRYDGGSRQLWGGRDVGPRAVIVSPSRRCVNGRCSF